jgi:hypothetical protein
VHKPVPDARLKYPTALQCFKKLLKSCGLNEKLFGLHSPRVGGTTDSFKAGVPAHIIDIRGRSGHTKKRYCRPPEHSWINSIYCYSIKNTELVIL